MKSGNVRHILVSFLYLLQISNTRCRSQTQDVNSPSYHKYAFATSYAWQFRFPVPLSTGTHDGSVQWRPNVRYSQEQIQLPNEYLIGSNYPGRYVKDQVPETQGVLQNSIPIQAPCAQGQQLLSPSTDQTQNLHLSPHCGQQTLLVPLQNQQPVYTGAVAQHGQFSNPHQGGNFIIPTYFQAKRRDQLSEDESSLTSAITPIPQEQLVLRAPLFNDQGQQTGWQFFPLPLGTQQVLITPSAQQSSQIYAQQASPGGVVTDQPTWQYQQSTLAPNQFKSPSNNIPLSNQEQTFQTAAFPGQSIPVTNIAQQGCVQQLGATICTPVSSGRPADRSFSSDIQSQEINRLLQSYQKNLLQVMLSLTQQPNLGGAATSADTKYPAAIAGATITNDRNGISHLNSFSYTNT